MRDKQNTSHAVMAYRGEPSNSLDDFPTPPWATRAFLDVLRPSRTDTAYEPCANRGCMLGPLQEYFDTVYASDIFDYGLGYPIFDFLVCPVDRPHETIPRADRLFFNPPFNLAMDFVLHGLDICNISVSALVRSAWAEGEKRYDTLFKVMPPTAIYQNVQRVPMVRGRYDSKASTATSYSWFHWDKTVTQSETKFYWIPPGKKKFFKEDDLKYESR